MIPRPGLHFEPPAWVTGGISTEDAVFLVELVERERPSLVVEIGVGAGTSSAALLLALDALPFLGGADRYLFSIDTRSTCYFDPTRAVGSAVAEMHPRHRTGWILDTDSSARRIGAARRSPAALFDLAFIDADHRHPWPLLDLLHLAPALRSEAWIALHDIALARLYPEFPSHGAEWLFRDWPGDKLARMTRPGAVANIAAVQLPADLRELVPMALELVTRPTWEALIGRDDVALAEVFAPVTAAIARRGRSGA